jgi:hydroxypyruvate reductase
MKRRWQMGQFLVVVSASVPETSKLVSADVLRALGLKGYLINVSRGSLVDEDALIDELEVRHHRRGRSGGVFG